MNPSVMDGPLIAVGEKGDLAVSIERSLDLHRIVPLIHGRMCDVVHNVRRYGMPHDRTAAPMTDFPAIQVSKQPEENDLPMLSLSPGA